MSKPRYFKRKSDMHALGRAIFKYENGKLYDRYEDEQYWLLKTDDEEQIKSYINTLQEITEKQAFIILL